MSLLYLAIILLSGIVGFVALLREGDAPQEEDLKAADFTIIEYDRP